MPPHFFLKILQPSKFLKSTFRISSNSLNTAIKFINLRNFILLTSCLWNWLSNISHSSLLSGVLPLTLPFMPLQYQLVLVFVSSRKTQSWRWLYSGLYRRVDWYKFTEVSEVCTSLHGATTQTTAIFLVTAVRTSSHNPVMHTQCVYLVFYGRYVTYKKWVKMQCAQDMRVEGRVNVTWPIYCLKQTNPKQRKILCFKLLHTSKTGEIEDTLLLEGYKFYMQGCMHCWTNDGSRGENRQRSGWRLSSELWWVRRKTAAANSKVELSQHK
jgi:hypothetical protein